MKMLIIEKGHSNKCYVDIMPTQDYKNKRLNREKGGYTYRCHTGKFTVLIGFTVVGDSVVVITVFKTERKT